MSDSSTWCSVQLLCQISLSSIDLADLHNIPLDVLVATNNDALPSSRHTEAQHLLSTALHDLSQLDTEIARLESTLASLKAQRPLDLAKIDLYRSALAPQRNIPNELLSEIFVHCCGWEPVSIPILPSKMPWVLGRVCSKWRHMANATHELWVNLYVTLWRPQGELPCSIE